MPHQWPNLAVLELLVAVGERGSLAEAARAVGVAQPNASRSLSRFERRLGLTLLERTPRGSTLTPAGAVLVDWARVTLEAAEHLILGAEALRTEAQVQLRVAASMTVAEYLVPRWLGDLRRLHPQLRVSLEVLNSQQVIELLEAGELELGFVESPTLPRALVSALVGRDRLKVVVHPAHAWSRRRRPLTPDELAATPLIVREPGSGTRTALLTALVGHHIADPAMELTSNAAVRVSAAAGVAPAVLSHLAVREALHNGDLRSVPVENLDLQRPLHAVWRPPRRLSLNPWSDRRGRAWPA
jgi:DNA-binding transcriptional LysR family regulator